MQTAGGALPGALSDTVAQLRAEGLLAAHTTAGPAYGGEREAISVAGALYAARDHEAIVAGPGPGILGSGSALGHGGLAALDAAHAALAAGCPVVVAPRMSESDPRHRHRGLSHHTATVLELLLAPVTVAMPAATPSPPRGERHLWRAAHDDRYDEYAASGLPATSMGRDDPLFFAAAAAAGRALAGMIPRP